MSLTKCIIFEEELEKNPELKLSDIQILKEWCKKQLHLPEIDDVQLIVFLHRNYYRVEPTKDTIEKYYTIRTHTPEFFSNRDLVRKTQLRDAFSHIAHLHLAGKTNEGYNIMLGRILNMDLSRYVPNDTIKASFMVLEEYIWTHGLTQGYVYIADGAGITMSLIARVHQLSIQKLASYVQEAFPTRLKAIHIINVSPIVRILYNMLKPFVKKELLDLIYLHTTMKSVAKFIPIEVLPNELGGQAGAIKELMEAQVKKVENFHEWFLEDERINRVNETLRITKSKIN